MAPWHGAAYGTKSCIMKIFQTPVQGRIVPFVPKTCRHRGRMAAGTWVAAPENSCRPQELGPGWRIRALLPVHAGSAQVKAWTIIERAARRTWRWRGIRESPIAHHSRRAGIPR